MAEPRIGVIGAGAWGINHVRVAAAEPTCRLTAVVDPDPAARTRVIAITPAVDISRDARSLLVSSDIDAVIIASPAPTHVELACAALAAGKHVLLEKPLALSISDAETLARAVARSARVLVIGHLMVFHPAVVRLRELVASGGLGELCYLHSIRANRGRIRSDESALWSFGPHELSILDYLFELQPASVVARGQRVTQRDLEDVVFVTIRYTTGELAHLHLSRVHPRKERALSLVCSRKLVRFDDVARDKLQIYGQPYDRPPTFTQFSEFLTLADGDVTLPQIAMAEPLAIQLRHFVDCIAGVARPRADIAHGLRIIRLLDAAQRSLDRDGAVMNVAPYPDVL